MTTAIINCSGQLRTDSVGGLLVAGTIAVILLSLYLQPVACMTWHDGSLKFEKDCSLIITKPLSLIGVAEYWDERVCLCVRKHFSETTFRSSQNFLCVTYVYGSVLIWRRCDTLCTSGFMDDVIFVHNGQYRAMEACRYRCSKVCHCVVVRMRRVLHDAGAETKRVHYASDAGPVRGGPIEHLFRVMFVKKIACRLVIVVFPCWCRPVCCERYCRLRVFCFISKHYHTMVLSFSGNHFPPKINEG